MSRSPPHPRIDQLLSRLGYGSRREVGVWLRAGRVRSGGAPVKTPSQRVDPATIRVDGEPLDHPDGVLALLNKPAGFVCSHDPRDGARVYDLLPEQWLHRRPPVSSVGRLDRETTGLLLLTDQGDLIHALTHPRRAFAKVYRVHVDHPLADELIDRFGAGHLMLPGERTPCRPAELWLKTETEAELTLHEGRYQQVRRMFASQGYRVEHLERIAHGPLRLADYDLDPGEYRELPRPWANALRDGTDPPRHHDSDTTIDAG